MNVPKNWSGNIRDDFSRIIKRSEIADGKTTISSYKYNEHGDLIKYESKQEDTLLAEIICRYEYDEHNNKTVKYIKNQIYCSPTYFSTEYVYHYKNIYEDNKLIKKTCLYQNEIKYMNQYYYDNKGKLIRIERFNNPPTLKLWRTDFLDYKDDRLIISIYLSDNTLSHYSFSDLKGGKPINRRIINPARGKYHWIITNHNASSVSVYIGENRLTSDILLEIVKYIEGLSKPCYDKKTLLIIECSDTLIDSSDRKIAEIKEHYQNQGITIVYSP